MTATKLRYVGKRLKRSWQWYVLLLPAFAYVALFSYGPMYGIQIAFRDYKVKFGMTGSEWVGREHFARFLSYPDFWKMIRNTLSITLYSLATFPCAIIFALMLNEVMNEKFKKTMQMITYAPHFMSEVVVCSIVIIRDVVQRILRISGWRLNHMHKTTNILHILPPHFITAYVRHHSTLQISMECIDA